MPNLPEALPEVFSWTGADQAFTSVTGGEARLKDLRSDRFRSSIPRQAPSGEDLWSWISQGSARSLRRPSLP